MPTAKQSAPAAGRRWMVAATALIPLLFFVLLEGGLRLAGYGQDLPAFVAVPENPDYLVPNPYVGRRYFAGSSVLPSPPNDAFLIEKPRNGLRIVVQGASSAAGFPTVYGGSFPRMLEQRLSQAFPSRTVEVVNTGIAAVSSYALSDLAPEIVEIEPDAVLVYAGHNEYYGALGVVSTQSLGSARGLVRLYLALDGLRIVQALRSVWSVIAGTAATAPGQTLMEELAAGRRVEYKGQEWNRGVDQFRENLTDLACRYRDAGIPTYLGTVVSNERDLAPLDGATSPGTDSVEWARMREALARSASQRDTAATLLALDDLVALDDAAAQAWYDRAALLDAAGRRADAATGYSEARDRDRLPFRAPSAMNRVIREVAQACGVVLVDVRELFSRQTPSGVPGHELILEHVHPNVDGYFLTATAFYEALVQIQFGGQTEVDIPAMVARRQLLVTDLDSALATLHVRRLLNSWPFQPAGSGVEDTIRVQSRTQRLAVEVFGERRTWTDATAELGEWHESEGRYLQALRASLALAQEHPYRAAPLVVAARLMARMGSPDQALEALFQADRVEPTADSKRMVGQMLVRTGRQDDAIPWLEQALDLDPEHAGALYDLGVAHLTSGRFAEAAEAAQRLLAVSPGDEGGRRLLERALAGANGD